VRVVKILNSRIAALETGFAALADDVAGERGRTDTLRYATFLRSNKALRLSQEARGY
jgi:hypothetical protein